MPRSTSRRSPLVYRVVLIAAAVLLFVSVWIVIPPPALVFLLLAIGAPELSLYLCAASILLSVIATRGARKVPIARLALVFSLITLCLAVIPLAQAIGAVRNFDAAMSRIPVREHPSMRKHVIEVGELLGHTPSNNDVRVTHGIEFARPDGVTLKLDLYEPLNGPPPPYPVIVQVYGGAWQTGTPSDSEWFARYFAGQGYLVVALDYRHAPKWRWPEQLEDVRSGLRWVAESSPSHGGNPARIVLVGRSSGAQLAMRMAYQEAPSSIKGVVNFYGPVDLVDGWRHPPQPDPFHVRSVLETLLGGTPDHMPERYRHASPITYAHGRVPPTLHVYGTRDHIVEARFGRLIDRSLKDAGNTSVLLEFPWSEHAFDIVPGGLARQISLFYVERFVSWALSDRS